MTYKQVFNFYKDKRDADCSHTQDLIRNGFCQKDNGYIEVAKASGFSDIPSQWWHLMQYILGKLEQHNELKEYPYTPCGELKFWMAEVSGVFSEEELDELKNMIINSEKSRSVKNSLIHKYTWSRIKTAVEKYSAI